MKAVYVAAASDYLEQQRAQRYVDALHEVGIPVVSTWMERIAKAGGEPNPRGKIDYRAGAVAQNLKEIDRAEIIWFLVPEDAPGRGGYYEAGYAERAGKHVVFSGDTQQSVFCSRGLEFAQDVEAFAHVEKMARQP